MKALTIKNSTHSILMIEYSNNFYQIEPFCEKTIEISENNRIRVFKSSCKLRVCLGQFLSKETLRNVWLFGPVLLTNFDAIFEIPNGLKKVNITGAYYHNLLYVLFGILLLDGKKAFLLMTMA